MQKFDRFAAGDSPIFTPSRDPWLGFPASGPSPRTEAFVVVARNRAKGVPPALVPLFDRRVDLAISPHGLETIRHSGSRSRRRPGGSKFESRPRNVRHPGGFGAVSEVRTEPCGTGVHSRGLRETAGAGPASPEPGRRPVQGPASG